jgi:hypothetical protein
VRLDLSRFAGLPGVQVRFVVSADAADIGYSFEGWYLDEIRVESLEIECVVDMCPVAVIRAARDSTLHRRRRINWNAGANPQLILGPTHREGPLVLGFDLSRIILSEVASATLVLTIDPSFQANEWGGAGRLVDVHALGSDFVEGNGIHLNLPEEQRFAGSGPGVTWLCAVDPDISKPWIKCTVPWWGGDFAPAVSDSQLHLDGMVGEVEWDVTDDVRTGVGRWVVRRPDGLGTVRYLSKEGSLATFGDLRAAPRLVVVRE